ANDYYLNLIGFTREELEQKQVSWRTITPPEWLPADELALRELQERGTCTPYEKEYVRRDGTRVPVFLTDALLPGTPEQIIAFALDLTERHRVEEALRVSEIRFRTTFEQAGVGVAVLTPDGRWFQVNQKLCDITGYSAEELLKMQVGDITHPDDLAATQECMRRMQKGEIQSCTVEKRNLRKDGSCVWVSVTVAQVRKTTGEQDYLIAMTEDITARKQAEDAQEKLQLQLSQAQKMESVGRLAGGIAHDFNNILQALMGYGRLLVDTLPRNSESYTYAKEIHTGTQRAATLTRQLLAFSRQQVLEQKSIDINDLVQNLLKMIGRLLGEDVEMIFKPSAKNLHIFADPGQMEQVLMNLCVNARDAMPNGGNLEIEIHDKVLDSSYCAVHPWAKPGAYALLIVSDTGTGMDPATCARIFDPFFTTKELGKGTGLGLATVYGIVKQHDGLIHVYSEIGQGTIFKVYLPLTEEAPEEEDMFLPQEIQGGTETILLVEDDEVLRMLACRILEPAGYTVIVASNGEEAAEQMRPAEKEIQLLLSDVLLPKGNGQEVFQVFHQQYPAGRAILMSGYGSTILKDGFWDSAQGAFLQKPFGPQDLLTKIRQVLDAPVPDS
ncbi:TPA: calcium-binding protein, partial [Candidatus Sumerlaeota bacterium]|nr:calcium-binding protein [Candidatus Sumerlaeota bacterium]